MNSGIITTLCLIGGIIFVFAVFLSTAIRIVPEYRRLIVFRLGRSIGQKGPGLVLLIPIVDTAVSVDLREQVREIPHQVCITKDNVTISVDFIWYYKVLVAEDSILKVGNFEAAAQGMATTTLRAVIGGIILDDVLSKREDINNQLRSRLDEVTERWGVKVTNVEIREINPPRDIQEAMNRQMTAERIRRAVVTESTGQREATINVAEGDKQSQALRAEGFATALERIYGIAQTVDQKTMTLQYFETLKAIGMSPSTKYIFPMEFTSLLENFTKGK